MPIDRALPSDGVPEATHFAEADAAGHVELQSQLSSPKDISAANSFFKPAGANQFLPDMAMPKGFEASAMIPPGPEAGLGMPPMPGAEQVSPLINMITKMPGHIGLLSNFFEFLGSFFGGSDLLSAFQDGLGGDLLGGIMDGAGEHMDVDISLLPDDAPILETLADGGGVESLLGEATGASPADFFDGTSATTDGPLFDSSSLNVSGGADINKPIFEHGNLNFDPNNHMRSGNFVAMDPGGGFSSTVSPAAPTGMPDGNQSAMPSIDPQGQVDPATNTGSAPGANPGANSAADAAGNAGENSGVEPSAATGSASGDAAETVAYKVQAGDNLWDIAGKQLGDSTRWGEIYKLNEGLIGQNPRLIMPGAELQLPGGADQIASAAPADYTVQPGDNLWDISKEHLGGGQHWPDLYHQNADVVGANPDLIHPGQHLHMTDATGGAHAAGSHLAGSNHLSHATGSHLAGSNHLSHATGAHHSGPLHHSGPQHHVAQHAGTSNHVANAQHTGGAHHADSIAHQGGDHQAVAQQETKSLNQPAAQSTATQAARPQIAQSKIPASLPTELDAQATTMSIGDITSQ